MKKLFFIDSENVGDSWISLLTNADEDDDLLIYYTLKSPHMNYEHLRQLKECTREVTFIKCYEGNNALDFQLVSDLGFRLAGEPAEAYIIITNDTGYDAVVRHWQDRSYPVFRIPAKDCKNYSSKMLQGKVPADRRSSRSGKGAEKVSAPAPERIPAPKMIPVSEETPALETVPAPEKAPVPETASAPETVTVPEKAPAPEAVTAPEKAPAPEAVTAPEKAPAPEAVTAPEALQTPEPIPAADDTPAMEILYCIGRKDLPDLHNSMIQLYGDKVGKEMYQKIKSLPEDEPYLAQHKVLDQKDKFASYCDVVFRLSDLADHQPKDFDSFLFSIPEKRKNLNSLRSALQSKYGKDYGMKYYALIKAHIKTLNRI